MVANGRGLAFDLLLKKSRLAENRTDIVLIPTPDLANVVLQRIKIVETNVSRGIFGPRDLAQTKAGEFLGL